MPVIHISEAEAVRDFASVLEHVRAGSEVVIGSERAAVAVLLPPSEHSAAPGAEHDAWFRSQVQQALDDPHAGIPEEEVETHFARRREASSLKLVRTAG